SGANQGIEMKRLAELKPTIIAGRIADKDSCLRAAQPFSRQPGVFKRFPGYLQQQPMLRIHALSLSRREPESVGIEIRHLLKEPSPTCVDLPRRHWLRIAESAPIPPIWRDLGDSVTSLFKEFPEGLWIASPSREPAAHPDNGDGFGLRPL